MPNIEPSKFEIKCKNCDSTNVIIGIDYTVYPEGSWCSVEIICMNPNCVSYEPLYDSNE